MCKIQRGMTLGFETANRIKVTFGNALSVQTLIVAKRAAMRRGIWFKALNRLERGIVDLTTKYVDNVKSTKLAKVLTAIVDKLVQASESIIDRMVRTIGLPLAQKICKIALSWGNTSASKWANDVVFAQYLAFCVSKT